MRSFPQAAKRPKFVSRPPPTTLSCSLLPLLALPPTASIFTTSATLAAISPLASILDPPIDRGSHFLRVSSVRPGRRTAGPCDSIRGAPSSWLSRVDTSRHDSLLARGSPRPQGLPMRPGRRKAGPRGPIRGAPAGCCARMPQDSTPSSSPGAFPVRTRRQCAQGAVRRVLATRSVASQAAGCRAWMPQDFAT